MSKALGDEKTAEWLEYNLSLIPECVEKMKSAAAARGSKLVSCSITINGYDSITSETCTRSEADPGTEKARKQLEERLENIKEEKKAEKRRATKKAEERRTAKKALEEQLEANMVITGNEVRIPEKTSVYTSQAINIGSNFKSYS